MQTLTIEPAYSFLIPQSPIVSIALIGCGGTGSHIAQALARLAWHCRDLGGPRLDLTFIDGDTVEQKNVGRQLFSVADVGRNKAQVLAGRFSAVFGLEIAAVPAMLNGVIFRPLGYGIVVGAVDSAAGRRACRELANNAGYRLWIDSGNHEQSGQVVAGSVHAASQLNGSLKNGLCSALPTAPLIYPELLLDAPPRPREDCAAAMQDNAQSLMVNQTMAAIVGQYLYSIVVSRKLTSFRTVVDLASLTMRSDAITAANLSAATSISAAQLRGERVTAKKGKKAA